MLNQPFLFSKFLISFLFYVPFSQSTTSFHFTNFFTPHPLSLFTLSQSPPPILPPFSSFSFTHPPLHLSDQFPFSTLSTLTAVTPRRFVPLGVVGTLGSPVVGSANFFLSYRAGGSRCDAGLQSELIIACRNCAAARRVHIIQLARGPAASLARANASIHSLSLPRVKIIRGGPGVSLLPSLIPRYASCPVPDVTDPLVPCLLRDPRPLSDRLTAPVRFLFPQLRRHATRNTPSRFLTNLNNKWEIEEIWIWP